jgi:hypothetical protein
VALASAGFINDLAATGIVVAAIDGGDFTADLGRLFSSSCWKLHLSSM